MSSESRPAAARRARTSRERRSAPRGNSALGPTGSPVGVTPCSCTDRGAQTRGRAARRARAPPPLSCQPPPRGSSRSACGHARRARLSPPRRRRPRRTASPTPRTPLGDAQSNTRREAPVCLWWREARASRCHGASDHTPSTRRPPIRRAPPPNGSAVPLRGQRTVKPRSVASGLRSSPVAELPCGAGL